MQPRPDPRCRLMLAHLEHSPGRFDLGPHAPPGDEGAGDRDRVIQNSAGAGGSVMGSRTGSLVSMDASSRNPGTGISS